MAPDLDYERRLGHAAALQALKRFSNEAKGAARSQQEILHAALRQRQRITPLMGCYRERLVGPGVFRENAIGVPYSHSVTVGLLGTDTVYTGPAVIGAASSTPTYASSDDVRHAFQYEAGHLFQSEASHRSYLMSATGALLPQVGLDDVLVGGVGQVAVVRMAAPLELFQFQNR
jgi:hypothetical protein